MKQVPEAFFNNLSSLFLIEYYFQAHQYVLIDSNHLEKLLFKKCLKKIPIHQILQPLILQMFKKLLIQKLIVLIPTQVNQETRHLYTVLVIRTLLKIPRYYFVFYYVVSNFIIKFSVSRNFKLGTISKMSNIQESYLELK